MQKIKLIFLLMIIGCTPNIQPEKAIELANQLFSEENIYEIDDCLRAQKYINNIRISLDEHPKQPNKETYYKIALEEENISEQKFKFYTSKLAETGLGGYLKVDNFSFFITGGAMGDINGIVVVHNNTDIPIDVMKLNNHYSVYFGNQIRKNVYYFSGG